jgi:hypothetical protein
MSLYALITDILKEKDLTRFDVAAHVPLKMIINDMSKLSPPEKQYAANILSHVDFLVFDAIGKTPRLVVEVDGAAFHAEGTRQSERDAMKNAILEKYDLPIIRFRTDGSGERKRLVQAFHDIINA